MAIGCGWLASVPRWWPNGAKHKCFQVCVWKVSRPLDALMLLYNNRPWSTVKSVIWFSNQLYSKSLQCYLLFTRTKRGSTNTEIWCNMILNMHTVLSRTCIQSCGHDLCSFLRGNTKFCLTTIRVSCSQNSSFHLGNCDWKLHQCD